MDMHDDDEWCVDLPGIGKIVHHSCLPEKKEEDQENDQKRQKTEDEERGLLAQWVREDINESNQVKFKGARGILRKLKRNMMCFVMRYQVGRPTSDFQRDRDCLI